MNKFYTSMIEGCAPSALLACTERHTANIKLSKTRGHEYTKDQIDRKVDAISKILSVANTRSKNEDSPLWNQIKRASWRNLMFFFTLRDCPQCSIVDACYSDADGNCRM